MDKDSEGKEDRKTYQPIGIIHTEFQDKKEAPIQGVFAKGAKGKVEVFPEYAAGLKDLEDFSHITLIYHFHRSDGYSLISKPFLEDEEHGIFSIRHFKRPNPIGLSVVKLESVKGNVLEISEVDILDGTPLLDIKPFVPLFDNREDAKSGWLSNPHLDLVKGESGKHGSE
ncbi:MAG: tRNA (N6-threonylcarbamoyladenosine(37)-N6)-methyltransferase TrmO [Euryarchaeota archaeon]|nr:tRNA (N6-threonylcarbamoyladenosine(37)-N6)-methyltransferase TrmO [Euryarchaeota archaeon]